MADSTAQVPVLERSGRAAHLSQLALIFYHRRASWNSFGQFLVWWCRSNEHPVLCRHNDPASPCFQTLRGTSLRHLNYPEKARWQAPCRYFGSFESGKNPGIVTADLAVSAAGWLDGQRRDAQARDGVGGWNAGDVGRDFAFEPSRTPSGPSSDSLSAELVEEPSSAAAEISRSNILAFSRREGEEFAQWAAGSDDSFLVPEGTGQVEPGRATPGAGGPPGSDPPGFDLMVSDPLPADVDSETDSFAQYVQRPSTTKMRAEVIGYLLQFADRPQELRAAFGALVGTSENLLHLCGCGIGMVTNGQRSGGCCEGSHLILGSQQTNRDHQGAHFSLARPRHVRDYTNDLDRFNAPDSRYPSCAGVF